MGGTIQFQRLLSWCLAAAAGLLAAVAAFAAPAQATAPPSKNGRIFYERGNDIYVMNANGSGQRNLTNTPGVAEFLPAVSPTGRRIAFSRCTADCDVVLANADGSGQRVIGKTADNEFAPTFFPGDPKIAFGRGAIATQIDVIALNVRTSTQVNLTNTPAYHEVPNDVSPNGRTILYTGFATSADKRHLFLMNGDGTGRRNLTGTSVVEQERFGSFLPNGRRVVFDRRVSSSDLWSINLNGSGQTPIGPAGGDAETQPVASPNGAVVAFTSFDGLQTDIHTIQPNGAQRLNLTRTPSPISESDPDWQPIQRCKGKRVTLVGDDGPDRIRGTRRRDVIDANGGRDVVIGRRGNDVICGGKGRDKLKGGPGKDKLFGNQAKDRFAGGPGRDRCVGGKGRDRGAGCEQGNL